MEYAIGIDIGGTNISCGIVNQQGDLIQSEMFDSVLNNREDMFTQVVKCIDALLNHSSISLKDIVGVGAGIPGKIDYKKGIAVFQNNLPWRDFPFKRRLSKYLKMDNIHVDNDVYMAALAEWNYAKFKSELMVYVTISTGVAISIINKGKRVLGAGFAGEMGLIPVHIKANSEEFERLEKIASGPAMEKSAEEIFKDKENISPRSLFNLFYAENKDAKLLMNEVSDALSQSLYSVISLLDPHKIIMGGSVAVNHPLLIEMIKEKLDTYLIEEQKHVGERISLSKLGNQQGVIGAGLSVFR